MAWRRAAAAAVVVASFLAVVPSASATLLNNHPSSSNPLEALFEAQNTILLDSVDGQDVGGCGINATMVPCSSISGALEYNNVADTPNETFALSLAAGNYDGKENQNVIIPSNVLSLSGVAGNPSAVTLTGKIFSNVDHKTNETVNTTLPMMVISSDFLIANVTFKGSFDIQTTAAVQVNVSAPQVASIAMLGIRVRSFLGGSLVSASLSAGSSLHVDGLDISDNTPFSSWFSLKSNSAATICSQGQQWPTANFNNIDVSGNSNIGSLVASQGVALQMSNAVISQNEFSLPILSVYTSCNVSLPSHSLQSVKLSDNAGSALVSLAGDTVVVQDLTVNNVTPTTSSGGYPVIGLYGRSVSVTSSKFENIGSDNGFAVISASFSWNPCPPGTPEQTCAGIFWKHNPTATFTDLTFANNSATAININVELPSQFSPAQPFQNPFLQVTVSSCQFVNNSNLAGNAGAISMTSSLVVWNSGGYGLVYANSTQFNEIKISDSTFTNNRGRSMGGAIYLASSSAAISNSKFVNNSVPDLSQWATWARGCYFDNNEYYGGGAIALLGNSVLRLKDGVSFQDNSVDKVTNSQAFGGAIACCAIDSAFNTSVVMESSVKFVDNTAPLIDDMTCSNSSWHVRLPVCQVEDSNQTAIKHADFCELGPLNGAAVTLIVVIPLVVVGALVVALVGLFVFRSWKSRHYERITDSLDRT